MRLLTTFVIATLIGGLTLFSPLTAASRSQAQEDEIRVLSHRAESHFPHSVRFFVEAAGPDEINDIRVYLKTLGQTRRSSYRQVEFAHGPTISGEAELLSGGNNYFPPGTRIAYSFEIRDTAGRSLRTKEEIFVYLDTRFEWLTVSDGLITVYYNNPLAEDRARHVLETASATLRQMGPVLGITPKDPLHIITYHRYRDMVDALPFRSRATQEQLQTLGMAFDQERVLMVYSGDSGVTGTTAHEFTHLLVGDATGRAYSRVPAWLNEGLAEYGDFTGDDNFDYFLSGGIASDMLRPLWHQGQFSGNPQDILIAYGQGKSVVAYLVSSYGEAKIADLMRAITKTLDIDKALMQVYNLDQYELDSAWRRSLGLEPLPRPAEPTPRPLPTATPFPDPTATAEPTLALRPAEPTPTESTEPTPTAEPTPLALITAEATPTPAVKVESPSAGTNLGAGAINSSDPDASAEPEAETASAGGCNAPIPPSDLGVEMGFLFLLASPVAMLATLRGFRRRR